MNTNDYLIEGRIRYVKSRKMWSASIIRKNCYHFLGLFSSEEKAENALNRTLDKVLFI